MSTAQSETAVVTDIRKIEMRRYPVPSPRQNDGVLKVKPCGICGSDLSKYMRIKDEAELEETYQLLKQLIPVKPYPTLEGFRVVLDELSEKIPAAKTANPKDFTDTRFLEELDRSGFFDPFSK